MTQEEFDELPPHLQMTHIGFELYAGHEHFIGINVPIRRMVMMLMQRGEPGGFDFWDDGSRGITKHGDSGLQRFTLTPAQKMLIRHRAYIASNRPIQADEIRLGYRTTYDR